MVMIPLGCDANDRLASKLFGLPFHWFVVVVAVSWNWLSHFVAFRANICGSLHDAATSILPTLFFGPCSARKRK